MKKKDSNCKMSEPSEYVINYITSQMFFFQHLGCKHKKLSSYLNLL